MEYNNYPTYGDGGFDATANYTDYNGDGLQRQQQTRHTLSPVTIKQVNDATQPVIDGDFKIGNVTLNMISFVGVVRRVDNQTSAVTVTVEDGTGTIDIRKWIDDKVTLAAQEAEMYAAMENKYVYVTGALKVFNNKKAIQQAVIREITDHNQVLYHMLYAVSNHLEAEGLLKVGVAKQEGGLFVLDPAQGEGLSVKDQIMAIITQNAGSMMEGVPAAWISERLGMAESVVRETCQALLEEGKIYPGYDDGAYLCL